MDEHAVDWAAVDAALGGGHGDGEGGAAHGPPDPRPTGPWRRGATWVLIAVSTTTVLLAGAALLVAATPAPSLTVDDAAASSTAPAASPGPLLVDVEGAVRHPGVVRLATGSRVADAIIAAGGYSAAVDAAAAAADLDLADLVQDGTKILVPQRGTATAADAATGATPRPAKVDLNRATAAELDTLPGIGPVTAGKIIASRQQQAFRRVDDLLTRKLVGAATYAKLQALVTV